MQRWAPMAGKLTRQSAMNSLDLQKIATQHAPGQETRSARFQKSPPAFAGSKTEVQARPARTNPAGGFETRQVRIRVETGLVGLSK